MESKLEQVRPANQSFVQIPSSSTNEYPSSEFDASNSCQTILNYSIQTGEEFSLEFIRERANVTKASRENASANQDIGICKDKNRIIGTLQSGLENETKVGLKGFAAIDDTRDSESGKWEMAVTPGVPASDSNERGISNRHASSVPSDHSASNVRFFCSFGGKIMPRPSDGKLRYVGGATHIIRLRNDISFSEVMRKTTSIYNKQHTIKYQLPGEDLDSLISVSCNEDLQNMMEECNFLEVDSSQKLRMFLFASGDTNDVQFGLGGIEIGSEIQYVAAVNGLEFGFDRGYSNHVLSKTTSSVSGLDHLLNFGNEDGNTAMNRVELMPIRVNPVPLGELMYPQISIYDNSPSLYLHRTHAEHAGGDDTFSQLAMLPMHTNGNQSNVDRIFPAHSPSLSMFNRKNDNQQSGGNLVSLAISQSLLVENVEDQDIKKDDPKLPKHKSDGEQFQSLENTLVSSTGHQYDVSAKFEEKSYSNMSEFVTPKLLSQKVLDPEKKSSEFEVSNVKEFCNLHGDDRSCNCTSPCSSRAYQSEGIPREPFRDASLSIVRSKSHDSIGCQFLIPNSHSDLASEDSICEPLNKLQFKESPSLTQQSILLAKLECPSFLEIKNGITKIENSSKIHDLSQMNTHHELVSDLNGKKYPYIFSYVGVNESSTSQNRHNKSSEITHIPCNLEDTESGNIEGPSTPTGDSKIDVIKPSIETTFKQQVDSDSFPPYLNWADGYDLTYSNNIDYEPQLRDVLADINNRFPPGMVSGIFKARNDKESSILHPLYKDKVALSVNVHNPDKKNWSYFQNLAQDQFRKDVSLIDPDHDDQYFPNTTNEEVSPQQYNSAPQKSEYFELDHDDSQIGLGEVIQRGGSGINDDNDNPLHQGFLSPCIRMGMDGEGMQVENPFLKAGDNLRDPLPDDEEGKLESKNADCPSFLVSGDCHLNNLQSIKNEDLEELRELGSGTFGTVYHGQWRGTDVAIKRIKKSCLTCHLSEQERLTMEFWREAEILSNLHHPNVLAFYGVVTDGLDSTLATITEFMVDGSLSNVLRNGRSLDYRKELIIAMDTTFGMEYLHSKNIVHFDLKCDNLLVNLKDPLRPICKVGDFGLSKIKQNTLVSGGVRGTLPWMAPELLNSSKVSEKVDVFSFGIVMWEILTGEEPYSDMHYGAIIGGILNNILRPPIPESCNPEWRMLMERCWDADPMRRPSFTEIATHLRLMYAAHRDKPLRVKAVK